MICPYCNQGNDVTFAEPHYLFALEKPYLNIIFHKNCYLEIKDTEKLLETVHKYVEMWYNMRGSINNSTKTVKNKSVRRGK